MRLRLIAIKLPQRPGHGTPPRMPTMFRGLVRHPQQTVSVLIVALLLAALLPLLSPWVMAAEGGRWTEICSASGTKRVPLDEGSALVKLASSSGDQSAPEGPGLMTPTDCPACVLHHTSLGLPPAPVLWMPGPGLRFSAPERFFSAARTAHAWAPALARAPPGIA